MRICELKEKEVINVCSGKRLGCIADVEINICTGEIEAIVIPGPGKICGFFGTECDSLFLHKKDRSGYRACGD